MLSSDAILERATELKNRGTAFVLATVVRCESPTSAKPGAKAIVDADGTISGWIGGGCAQPAVIATAKKALADGQPRLIRVSPTKGGDVESGVIDFGMTCHSGGTLDIFLEPFAARPRLLIIGASPAAQALSALAQRSGFDVIAAFPGADAEMYPDAVQVIDGLDREILRSTQPRFIVVATQGKRDEEGLETALAAGAATIAFIASGRKAEKLRAYLKERGHPPECVDAIVSPAGVEINAVTPEEIAVSVLAGLIKARRDTDADLTSQTRSTAIAECTAETREQATAAMSPQAAGSGEAIDPVCGMTVTIASADYHSEHAGQRYYFCCTGCQHSFEKAPEHYLSNAGASA